MNKIISENKVANKITKTLEIKKWNAKEMYVCNGIYEKDFKVLYNSLLANEYQNSKIISSEFSNPSIVGTEYQGIWEIGGLMYSVKREWTSFSGWKRSSVVLAKKIKSQNII